MDPLVEAQLDADIDNINAQLPPPGISVKRSSRDITFTEFETDYCSYCDKRENVKTERATEVFCRTPRNEVWKHTEVNGYYLGMVGGGDGACAMAKPPTSTLEYFSSPLEAVSEAKALPMEDPECWGGRWGGGATCGDRKFHGGVEKYGEHTFMIKEDLSKSPFNKLARPAARTVKQLAGSYILREHKSTSGDLNMDTTTFELAADGAIRYAFRNDRQPGNGAPQQEVGETTGVVTRVTVPKSSAKIKFTVDGNAMLMSSGGGEVLVVKWAAPMTIVKTVNGKSWDSQTKTPSSIEVGNFTKQ